MSDSATPWTATPRLPCPPPSLRVCSNSCALSWWCCLSISSSSAAFSFCLQSFLASGSFPMRWLFTSSGQSIGSSASVLPMNISFRIDWFPLGLTDLISLMDSQEPPPAQQFERHLFLGAQPSLSVFYVVSHLHMTTGKTIALTIGLLSAKWCLCFLICCLDLSLLFFQGASFF